MGTGRIAPADGWVPQECTLPRAERAPRLEQFDELVFGVVRDQHRPEPTTLRLTLDGGAEAAAGVRNLIRRESRCCPFFTFTLSGVGDARLGLDIEVPASRVDVLDALADRAAAAIGSRP